MMAKSKKGKVQEPAYKVLATPKTEAEEDLSSPEKNQSVLPSFTRESGVSAYVQHKQIEQANSSMTKPTRGPSQMAHNQNERGQNMSQNLPMRRHAAGPFGRQSARARQMKPTGGPARSLMSLDFSGMGGSGGRNNPTREDPQPFSGQSSDDYTHKDRRRDWKNGRSNPTNQTPLLMLDDKPRDLWGRPAQPLSHAPLIVDMGLRAGGEQIHTNQQHQSLLGDYWASHSGPNRPASLMDLTPKDRLGRYRPADEPATHRHVNNPGRPDNVTTVKFEEIPPTFQPQQRNTGVGGGRSWNESNLRKRTAQTLGNEMPQQKMIKREHSIKPKVDISNRLVVCKGSGRSFLLIPALCSTTYLHGRARITVLRGEVSILAYKLRDGVAYDVFSPTSGSLLALNCAGGHNRLTAEEVKKELAKFNITEMEKDLENLGNTTISILMVDKLESAMCDYITSFIPYMQLFTAPQAREKDAHSARSVILPKLGLKVAPLKDMVPTCLTMSREYEDVLRKLTTHLSQGTDKPVPVWLCCGAKNTGKSTFCRMLINTALQSVDAVGFLECDVGQTEFSPPATLSFHIIKKPVLGQPFCHQRRAERMAFYGDIASGHNPTVYIKCLKHVLAAYTEMEDKPPLIVNTMGFPEGVGLMLMVDTVQLVCPTVVVQIESQNQAANFPAITQELVALEEGWTTNKQTITDPKAKVEATPAHELILLSTLNQRRDYSLKLKPVDLRNLSLLSSLTLDLEAGLTLTSVPPLVLPFRQLGVHVCHHRLSARECLAALDVSVVALCTADLSQAHREDEKMPLLFDEMPVCDCLGLAMVRAVDMQKGLLYLTTTLPRVSLTKVNTLLKGCLSLPDQIILKQKPLDSGTLPYIDALAPSTGVSAVRPRARMPRLTLGSGNNNA